MRVQLFVFTSGDNYFNELSYNLPFPGAPQVLRYSVAKEVEAISGRDVRLEMEVCSDPIPSRTTWDWGTLRVDAGQGSARTGQTGKDAGSNLFRTTIKIVFFLLFSFFFEMAR